MSVKTLPSDHFVDVSKHWQVVAPKKASLAQAEGMLGELMAELRIKQAELEEVTNKLLTLTDELSSKQEKKKVSPPTHTRCL